jgi:hypothetical protein
MGTFLSLDNIHFARARKLANPIIFRKRYNYFRTFFSTLLLNGTVTGSLFLFLVLVSSPDPLVMFGNG